MPYNSTVWWGLRRIRGAERPFGQSVCRTDLSPTFKGAHYKFTLFLPVTEKVVGEQIYEPVFTKGDLEKLCDLFNADFGGATLFMAPGPPPLKGTWKDGDKVVINGHAKLDVYSRLSKEAEDYFTELKARIMRHVDEVRHMRQDEIVIEINIIPDFVPRKSLEEQKAELEERLNNLKR